MISGATGVAAVVCGGGGVLIFTVAVCWLAGLEDASGGFAGVGDGDILGGVTTGDEASGETKLGCWCDSISAKLCFFISSVALAVSVEGANGEEVPLGSLSLFMVIVTGARSPSLAEGGGEDEENGRGRRSERPPVGLLGCILAIISHYPRSIFFFFLPLSYGTVVGNLDFTRE